jgi:hypothetical protein
MTGAITDGRKVNTGVTDVFRGAMRVQVNRVADGPRPYGWVIRQEQGKNGNFAVAVGNVRYRNMEEALEAGRAAMFKLQHPR